MIHDMRPAVMNAIRRGINRRGAVTALLAAIPFAPLGVEHASATRNQRHGTRSAKSERKRKKKARAGPAGPQGAQGPAGGRGPAGQQGATGPKAITAPLVEHRTQCSLQPSTFPSFCIVSCSAGEIPISGGFEASTGVSVIRSFLRFPSADAWVVAGINTTVQGQSLSAMVYCLPT
jgi:hypothetical protein